MIKGLKPLAFVLLLSAALQFALLAPSQAQVSFAGQKIELVVPFKSGGGTDRWARYWAPLIAEKLPGNPTIRIRNVYGGGSTKGANQFAKEATDDGLMLFASSASVMFPYLLGDRRVGYDYGDWRALLVSPTGGVVYASPEVVYHDDKGDYIDQNNLLSMSVQGPTQLGILLMLSAELLGYEYNVNFGAGGGSSTFRTFREGFTNIDMQTTASYLTNVQRLESDGKAVPVFSFGVTSPDGRLARDRNFPQIPHFIEFYRDRFNGSSPEGQVYEAWEKFYKAGFPAQKMLIIPKNTKPEIVAAYENAIMAVLNDPDLDTSASAKILGEYPQYYGEEAQTLMEQATVFNPETVKWFKEWIATETGIKI